MGKKRKLDLGKRLELESRLTEEHFYITFENMSKGMMIPLTWIEFCSHLGLTVEEVEEKAEERLVRLYKQKCRASIVASLKKNPQTLLRYYELEYQKDDSLGDIRGGERK